MRFQSNESPCGAVALYNACLLLRTQRLLEEWIIDVAGTAGPVGTQSKGITKAARVAGLGVKRLRSVNFPADVVDPMILAVDQDEHWVVAQRMANGRYFVADGAAIKDVAFSLSQGELAAWACSGKSKKPFTCLVVSEATEGPKPRVVYSLEVPKKEG